MTSYKPFQDDETTAPDKGVLRRLTLLLLGTAAVRIWFLWLRWDQLEQDPDAYRSIAESLRTHGVFGWPRTEPDGSHVVSPTAFRPPLYPLVLATFVVKGQLAAGGVALVHLFAGITTVLVTFRLGLILGLGPRSAFIAGFLVAVDPILLNQSTLVMTETLAALLGIVSLSALVSFHRHTGWRTAIAAGASIGLSVLCRPTFLAWGLLVFAPVCWLAWNRRKWQVGAAFLISTLLVVAPWAVRNQVQFDQMKVTTTHGGYTLLLGNNPEFYRFLQTNSGETWDSSVLLDAWMRRRQTSGPDDASWNDLRELASGSMPNKGRSFDEIEDDRFAYQLARRYIREHPRDFFHASFVRLKRLWQLVPKQLNADESIASKVVRWLIGCWYLAALGLAVMGIWRAGSDVISGRPEAFCWGWGVLLCVAFSVVHTLYWSNMRMRAPLVPFLCLLAATGHCWIRHFCGRIKSR